MTPEQYAVSQAAITSALASYVQRMASLFTGPALSLAQWRDFLRLLFPEVQKRYSMSASLGRQFYDSQRKKYHPDLVRNDRPLSELRWDWFVQDMEPARKALSLADAPQTAVNRVTLAAVREVEMAGRRQVIGAVNNDPDLESKLDEVEVRGEERPVIGWARVATGRETCAWCLMLISRGAELNHKGNFAYAEAATAGLRLDDETAIDIFNEEGGDPAKFLARLREESDDNVDEWHAGCDCVAVPVFDLNDWPGREQATSALQLWVDASLIARGTLKADPDKMYYSQKESRWKKTTLNRETLNELRRRLSSGETSMSNYAAAA